jgi:tRNA-modifying protein YgfZ
VTEPWRSGLAERGARIVEDSVVAFHDRDRIAQAVTAGTTITPLLAEGLILASGEDAQAFLQGQLSNDVAQVSPGQSQLAAYCTPKGRVLATLLLWAPGEAYALQLPRELVERIAKRLQMYVLRSRVHLGVASDQMALVGVTGAEASDLVHRELGISPSSAYEVGSGDGVTAIALPGNRVQVVVKVERGIEIWDRLARHSTPAGQEVWDWPAVASGVPTITTATQDQFVPQMLNFELLGGVSFRKGCYPGQEIVARTQHLGQVKRRLARFAVPEGAVAGATLLADGQPAGIVINATPSPDGGWELLAVVQIEAAHVNYAGAPLRLGAEGPVLRWLPLPYPLPGTLAQRTGDGG